MDDGVEDTFAPELIRTDQVTIDEAGAAVHIGETCIHFAADADIVGDVEAADDESQVDGAAPGLEEGRLERRLPGESPKQASMRRHPSQHG